MPDEKHTDTTPETLEESEAAAAAVAEDADEEGFTFVEDPSYDIDYKGDCFYEVKVTVPPENLAKQSEALFDELQNEVEVPGFRRGRAPRKLIERKFAKAVANDAEGKIVGAAFEKLVKDEDMQPIGTPDVDGLDEDHEPKLDEPLEFALKFEVAPRIELGDFSDIEVERPVLKVDPEQVDGYLDQMREQQAVYETEEGAKAQEGDQVIIDFEGMVDGEAFAGGSAKSYPYILGTQRFFPEFEEVLSGSSAGDELTCTVTFPDDYFNEDLRGRQAEFKISVQEVKRRQMPALDDEFAKQSGFEDLADMRAKAEEQLRGHYEARSNQVAEMAAMDVLVEKSSIEIPKSLFESVTEDQYQAEVQRLMRARVPASEIRDRDEDIRKEAREAAERSIKRILTIHEFARKQGIQVTDEDMEREAAEISERTGMQLDMVNAYLSQGERRSDYEDRIYREKAGKALLAEVKVKDKPVEKEEIDKEQAELDSETEE